jgi:LPXTG-motif cell wall-anchored protein
MAVLCALALPMVAAGAQTVDPDVPGDCLILSVTPNPVPAGGGVVSVSGTAANGVTVQLFIDGVAAAPVSPGDVTSQLVTDGTWALSYKLTTTADVSVGFTTNDGNAYTGGCTTPGGETVVRVDVAVSPADVVRPNTAALAFTGSSDTPSYVLIGIAAIVVGTVLVVAARRRKQVS